MALPVYLAMTATELSEAATLPEHTAWMACHFSSHSTGLSNIPEYLPAGSMLILDDSTPFDNHDPEQISSQLSQLAEKFTVKALLLDLQRPTTDKLISVVTKICESAVCPVAVPPPYLQNLNSPVFLPPIPLDTLPEEYLRPYRGRDIWLELALDCTLITVTPEGSRYTPLPQNIETESFFIDEKLHCAYSISVSDTQADFTLWRTRETLRSLLEETKPLGVSCGIGLYQELAKNPRL